jgi:hypothetical protein
VKRPLFLPLHIDLNLIGLQPETNNLSRERCQLKGKTVFFFLMLGLKFGTKKAEDLKDIASLWFLI